MDCGVYWQARYAPEYWFMFVYNANAASYSHKSNCPPFFRGKHLFKKHKNKHATHNVREYDADNYRCTTTTTARNKQSLRPPPSSLFLLYSTDKDCGPLCCFAPPLATTNLQSLFFVSSYLYKQRLGPRLLFWPPPSNNPPTNKDWGPLCCSDPPPLQQPFYKNNSQDDVE